MTGPRERLTPREARRINEAENERDGLAETVDPERAEDAYERDLEGRWP